MPQIGWSEILVIVVLTIIIIGPKDIPIVLRKVGSWIGSFKRYINNIQNELSIFESLIKATTFFNFLNKYVDGFLGSLIISILG